MVDRLSFILITALSLLPSNAAHSNGAHAVGLGHSGPSMVKQVMQSSNTSSAATMTLPSSYFTHGEHSGLIFAHILLMLIAWFVILPLGVMLSVANLQSRVTVFTRLLFLSLNGVAIAFGIIYNSRVPNLYEKNSHHRVGWILTWITLAQFIIEVIGPFAGRVKDRSSSEEREALMPVSAQAITQHEKDLAAGAPNPYRYSYDSGHGTDQDSSESQSGTSLFENEEETLCSDEAPVMDGEASSFEVKKRGYALVLDSIRSRIRGAISSQILGILGHFNWTVDLLILPLGFVAIVSGMVVYGGVFRGNNVFNGLAHTIKGGIFFWYGLLTLGRWMGCFVEYGWAWNIRPPLGVVSARKAAVPSAEFVESFVIFLYGSTNVFLEHLAAWGHAWSAQDLEHVSISAMFFGGGLCGMLLESRRVRELLNTTVLTLPVKHTPSASLNGWITPKTYSFSLNPFPALIILLLGCLMGAHHQDSAISTMIHKQWGTLLVGFSVARAFTYVITYISPPSSFLPSRPPTEVISSFCLISGGIIFMASNKDTVHEMERYGLDAMFTFTLTMGLTGVLMAWTIVLFGVRGWAVRKGVQREGGPISSSIIPKEKEGGWSGV